MTFKRRRVDEQNAGPLVKKQRRSRTREIEQRRLERETTLRGRLASLLKSAQALAKKRGEKGRPNAAVCNLTMANMLALWEKQHGRCAISGKPLTLKPGILCVSQD